MFAEDEEVRRRYAAPSHLSPSYSFSSLVSVVSAHHFEQQVLQVTACLAFCKQKCNFPWLAARLSFRMALSGAILSYRQTNLVHALPFCLGRHQMVLHILP
jgi:hypothetical protein